MSLLGGKVAIVTGAASGIGRAAAERFVADGASVLAVDLDGEGLGWADDVKEVEAFVGSIAEPDVNVAMVARAVERWGRVDLAFLNAGVLGFGSILDPSLEMFDRNLAVNLMGPIHGLRAVIPALQAAGGGAIVVTASTAALGGDAGLWPYNTTKAAVVNLVRSVAGEMAVQGIRINAVCPGSTMTPMAEALLADAPEFEDIICTKIPMRRWGQAAEIASVVAFLLSDQASYVTGAIIPVDGGLSALTRQLDLPPVGSTPG